MLILFSNKGLSSVSQQIQSQYFILPSQKNQSIYAITRPLGFVKENDSPYYILLSQNNQSSYIITQIINHPVENESRYSILVGKTNQSTYNILAWHYAKYSILVAKTNQSEYSIQVSQSNSGSYSTLVNQLNQSSYAILVDQTSTSSYDYLITQTNQSSYSVQVSKENVSIYLLPLIVKNQSEYIIWQIFHPTQEVESKYRITDFTWVSKSNESRYEISLEGVTSVSERYILLHDTYYIEQSERSIHPHLYNTYDSDRTGLANGYSTHPNDRTCIVVREIIGNERSGWYERYYIESTERDNYLSSIEVHVSERNSRYEVYALESSDRHVLCSELLKTGDERDCFTICIYNTYRYAFVKSWYVEERVCVTHSKDHDTGASQRHCLAQIRKDTWEVIRSCYFESTSIHFNLVINPKYNEDCPDKTINDSFQPLFEGIPVTDYDNQFNQIPLPILYPGVDLILINEDGSYVENLAATAQVFPPLHLISTNTYHFDGYLIHRHKPLYTKHNVMFTSLEDGFTDPDEYYQHLIRHGYLKIDIHGEEISDREAHIECQHPFYPIPYKLWILDDIRSKVIIEIVWAYPYKLLNVHKCLIRLTG